MWQSSYIALATGGTILSFACIRYAQDQRGLLAACYWIIGIGMACYAALSIAAML